MCFGLVLLFCDKLRRGYFFGNLLKMEISTRKRARSANWNEGEKRLLNQLILQRVDVIENKDTSTNTNSLKKAAWQEVLSSYNSLNSKKRELKELINQWRNTKGKVKSRESEYKRAKLMTGGGPPPPSPPAEDLAILQAIPNEFAVDSNRFDSDSLYTNTFNQSPTPTPENLKSRTDLDDPWTPLPSSSKQIDEAEEISEDVKEPGSKRELFATPINTKKGFKPQNKKNNNKNYEHELFLIAKRSKERENERAEEIHSKRMAIMDLEYEYWRKKLNNNE